MGGRIYDPGLGRFMSADPIISDVSNVQRLNQYSYVLNSPLSYLDPSGFDGCKSGPDGAGGCEGGFIDISAWFWTAPITPADTHVNLSLGVPDEPQASVVQKASEQLRIDHVILLLDFGLIVDDIVTASQILDCPDFSSECHREVATKVTAVVTGAVGGNYDTGDGERSGSSGSSILAGTSDDNSVGATEKEEHYNRNKDSGLYNNAPATAELIISEEGWEDKWVVRQNVEVHNIGVEGSGNLDFRQAGPCSPCVQLVYDRDGLLVTDQTNMGSLDYVSPDESLSGHFNADVLPWIKYGNGPQDTTTSAQRLGALLATVLTPSAPLGADAVRAYYNQGFP